MSIISCQKNIKNYEIALIKVNVKTNNLELKFYLLLSSTGVNVDKNNNFIKEKMNKNLLGNI